MQGSVWAGAGRGTLAAAVLALTVAACGGGARAQDVFSSNSGRQASRGGTATQGVVGNPNCAAPVLTQNGTTYSPLNWSCRTGTQSTTRGWLLGNGQQPPASPSRGSLLAAPQAEPAQVGPQQRATAPAAAPGRIFGSSGYRPRTVPMSYNPFRNLPPAILPEQAAASQARQNQVQQRGDIRFFNWAAQQVGVPQLNFGPTRSHMNGR